MNLLSDLLRLLCPLRPSSHFCVILTQPDILFVSFLWSFNLQHLINILDILLDI